MRNLLALRDRHWPAWARLLEHPFVQRLQDGEVTYTAGLRWLEQLYPLTQEVLRLKAKLLLNAPRPHQLVLAYGLVAAVEELDWLEVLGINPNAPRHPTIQEQLQLLKSLAEHPYPVAIVGLWVLHRAFLDVWMTACPACEPLGRLTEYLSSSETRAYMHDVSDLAEEALIHATPEERTRIEEITEAILRYENALWDLALSYAHNAN